MAEYVTCEVCNLRVTKDHCVRLTEWTDSEREDEEWCCAMCASKAMKFG